MLGGGGGKIFEQFQATKSLLWNRATFKLPIFLKTNSSIFENPTQIIRKRWKKNTNMYQNFAHVQLPYLKKIFRKVKKKT